MQEEKSLEEKLFVRFINMSRIGKMPVKIPQGVEASIKDGVIKVKGPKGLLEKTLPKNISAQLSDGVFIFTADNDLKSTRSSWGLARSLVFNMVEGVTTGFKKELEIIGVGYRAAKKGNGITISVGYSHPVEFIPLDGITLEVTENTKISVSGADKELVGLTAAKIRKIRKPEPYKGKGIKYSTEHVRRKAGKTAAKSAA